MDKKEFNLTDGYQVCFETYKRNSEFYEDEEYNKIVYKLSCLIGLDANIRVYKNNSHISFNVKDFNTSLSLAALFNQKSFWDWNNTEEFLNDLYQPILQ